MLGGLPPLPPCEHCGGRQYREVVCATCAFPVFGLLGGMRMLAQGLVAHFGHTPGEHPRLVEELELIIGDELLTMGREALAVHGLTPDGEGAPTGVRR